MTTYTVLETKTTIHPRTGEEQKYQLVQGEDGKYRRQVWVAWKAKAPHWSTQNTFKLESSARKDWEQ